MFADFSFAPPSTTHPRAADTDMHTHAYDASSPRAASATIDEGYCSSVSESISDLSRRFDRHSLRAPAPLERRAHPSTAPPPPQPPRRSSSPPPLRQLHSIRHQRQLATRRQCSTENLARISHLVHRMLHDDQDDPLARQTTYPHQVTHHLAHRRTHHPANPDTSSPCASPLSPTSTTSSAYDSESDYRPHDHPARLPWSAIDGARTRRADAVEKTIRMRRRPGGRPARRKE
ncbi:hypothetical protein MMC11_008666 [Xylographa trunciseda]|nr:hypothetical protein [Xylographa trunciseda]